jgi:hypothetical protein
MKLSLPPASGFTPHVALKIFLVIVVALAALMSLKSDFNTHPDEVNHFLAAQYYTKHFFPPVIEDPAIRESYSVYGVSYLNYHWAEYLYAGKFAWLASPFFSELFRAARFSAVFLFATLAAFFFYRSRKENAEEFVIACFLLVTPQIWYIFSYVNNDVFALFAAMLTAYQMASPKSLLHKFLQAENFSANSAGGIFFGILIGLLLIAKANYLAFLLFAALWLLYKFPVLRMKFENRAPRFSPDFGIFKKYAFIALVGFLILTFRCGLDFYVNGETNFVGFSYLNKYFGNLENKGKLLAYQEEIADYCCKPSTLENDLANSHKDLHLKAKGLSLKHLFSRWEWHKFSFASFVGGYGWMDIWASRRFYRSMAILYILFGVYLTAAIVRSKDRKSLAQLGIFLFGLFLTVSISVALSWVYAFQPQGRYLFPAIPMLGLLVYSVRRHLHNLALHAFIVAAFLLSIYSFVFVALPQINPTDKPAATLPPTPISAQ